MQRKTVKVKEIVEGMGGTEFIIEDWGENVLHASWVTVAACGNPVAIETG